MSDAALIPLEHIQSRILVLRGVRVVLDRDLATLYGVTTKRVMEQMTLMHQGKLDALTRDFTISVATGRVAVVTMVPRDESVRGMLASLEIWMQPDFSATREVVMNEPGGDRTRIIFRREKRDVKIPPGAFDQTKPLDMAAIKAAVGDGK